MNIDHSRHGRLFYWVSVVLALGLASITSHAQAPALTTVDDTVYRADGSPAAGNLVLTWPAFTTADNKPVAAGEMTVTLGAAGALHVQLAPNEGAVPAGSYYKVVYKLSDGTTSTEYWTVPAASPTTIGAIRAQVVPSQMAAQLVTRQYVDSILAGGGDALHKSGAESVTGVKTFTVSPLVPEPATDGEAANKGYVDTAVASAGDAALVHKSGAETITGVKTFSASPAVPTPGNNGDAANKDYVDAQDAAILHVQPDPGAANNFLTGITSAGTVLKSQPAFANLSGTVTDAQVPNNITIDLAGQATALAANGTNCAAGQAAAGVDASGNAEGCAAVSGGGGLLDYQKATAAVTGDGTDKTLFTTTLPAGALGAGKGLRIFFLAQHTTGTASIAFKIWFGSTAIITQTATATSMGRFEALVFNDPGSTSAQQTSVYEVQFGSTPVAMPGINTAAEDTTAPVVVKVTFVGAATEAVTPKMWVVEAVK